MAKILFAILLAAGPAAAHDIPADVRVQAILKPVGTRLHLLVRVPLRAIRDIAFPETAGGYLDVERLAPLLPDAARLWIAQPVRIEENGVLLGESRVTAVRISLPSDRSFTSYEEAMRHVRTPMPAGGESAVWNQVLFDVLLEYRIQSEASAFAIHPSFTHLAAKVATALQWMPAGGEVRAFEFSGDPGLTRLDPRWHQAALAFVWRGFQHILDGADHLLFLLCLVIPCRQVRPLATVVTAFAVAHSVTLIASAFGWAPGVLWFPASVEMLIALSIVYMALENIVRSGRAAHGRWMVAFFFGLIHGFGFSFALRDSLQFAGNHLLVSLLSFNAGVELGQLLVVILLTPAVAALMRYSGAERMIAILLSAFVAHTGWHWTAERFEALRMYSFEWPVWDAATIAAALRWAMGAVAVTGLVLLMDRHLMPRMLGWAPSIRRRN
ncbi:MAG: HupE/UreJ family protein [Bryobacterales bacterium]|nr:HupE/UreJ family protein [Bryobacterales bacterium]